MPVTLRQYDLKAQELIRRIQTEAPSFASVDPERKARAQRDYFFFLRTYLPHYFDSDFSTMHRTLERHMQVKEKPVIDAAPRGFGKTSFCTIGRPIYNAVFQLKRFQLIVSDTEDQAADFVKAIRLEFEFNARLRQDFGELVGTDWSDTNLVTKNNVRILALGRGQKVRGRRFRQYRPDFAVVDDFENDKNVKNPQLVKEGVDWILQALIPGLTARGWGFIFIGNVLAPRCVLTQLVAELKKNGADFVHAVFRAEENGKSTWPSMFPIAALQRIKRLIGSIKYNKEYQNDPKDEEGPFREEWLRVVDMPNLSTMRAIVSYLDPSAKRGEENDFKALVTLAFDGERYICLSSWIRRESSKGMMRAMYALYQQFRPVQIGVEDVGFQTLIIEMVDDMAKEYGYLLPMRPMPQRENKETRILRLSPLMEREKLVFVRDGDFESLKEQLLYFPSTSVKRDGPDALEGAVRLMERVIGKTGVRASTVDAHSSFHDDAERDEQSVRVRYPR